MSKRPYYKRYKYDDPWCPACDLEMEEVHTGCGDDDERCECDTLYACLSCGWRLGVYCPPHGPEQREEKIPMFDDLSGEVRSEIDELRTQRQLTEER
jgi:hypothetical protein